MDKKIFLFFLFFLVLSLCWLIVDISTIPKENEFCLSFQKENSLRIDYFRYGNSLEENILFESLKKELFWSGSTSNLTIEKKLGNHKIELNECVNGKLIYSQTYSSFFVEWKHSDDAKSKTDTFPESVIIPLPKKTSVLSFFSRNDKNEFDLVFQYTIDEKRVSKLDINKTKLEVRDIYISGDIDKKTDIILIPEGYTDNQMDDFIADCNIFCDGILNQEPFLELKNQINIRAVISPSQDSGTDIPSEGILKNTVLNTSFSTFDSERYLTSQDIFAVNDQAASAPNEQIVILVNTSKYGGAGLYNVYSLFAAKHKYSSFLFYHEFGHGFAGLGDEYYTSEVAYDNIYSLKNEPWEPNITTRVDFASKWKGMILDTVPIPTPQNEKYKNTVGVFEGGGYRAKGVFRPYHNCIMKSSSATEFCPVCQEAIKLKIFFNSPKKNLE